MQEHIVGNMVKSIRKIKIYSISLALTADNRSQKVKKRHEVGNCRFSPGEAMLIWIKFNEMKDMIMNNEFKQLREVIENRNGSIVAHSGMTASFKYGYNGCFLPYSRKILLGQVQVKYMPKNWNKNI
jgi:hypothetical protein